MAAGPFVGPPVASPNQMPSSQLPPGSQIPPAQIPGYWQTPQQYSPYDIANRSHATYGLVAFVLGISPILWIALIANMENNGWVVFVWLITAIVAIVMGLMAVRHPAGGQGRNRGMAVAGIVLGGLSVVFFVVAAVWAYVGY